MMVLMDHMHAARWCASGWNLASEIISSNQQINVESLWLYRLLTYLCVCEKLPVNNFASIVKQSSDTHTHREANTWRQVLNTNTYTGLFLISTLPQTTKHSVYTVHTALMCTHTFTSKSFLFIWYIWTHYSYCTVSCLQWMMQKK